MSAWNPVGDEITRDEFRKLLMGFSHSAVRLETLPAYAVSHEDLHYAAYRRGDVEQPFKYDDWKDFIRNATSSGKHFEILRIVPEQMTEYFRYEVDWAYLEYEKDGQATRFIEPQMITPELRNFANLDYWLVDAAFALQIKYDEAGKPVAYIKITESEVVEVLNKRLEEFRSRSISLHHFLEKHEWVPRT